MIFYETENFDVNAYEKPFVSREEGGHVIIFAKDRGIGDITQLSPKQAMELVRLVMIVGEAIQTTMNKRGIPVVRINYQSNGNWAYKENKPPHFHMHIFGRAENAIKQKWPEALSFPSRASGFYDGFKPLDNDDVTEILKHIRLLETAEKYLPSNWNMSA